MGFIGATTEEDDGPGDGGGGDGGGSGGGGGGGGGGSLGLAATALAKANLLEQMINGASITAECNPDGTISVSLTWGGP